MNSTPDTHQTLQRRCQSMAEAVEALSRSHSTMEERARGAESRLEVQRQLHAENTAELRARHKILQERAVSLAAWAEQHRIASRKHSEKLSQITDHHRALTEENGRLKEQHASLQRDLHSLTDRHSAALKTLASLEQSHRQAVAASEERHRRLVNELCKLSTRGPA